MLYSSLIYELALKLFPNIKDQNFHTSTGKRIEKSWEWGYLSMKNQKWTNQQNQIFNYFSKRKKNKTQL